MAGAPVVAAQETDDAREPLHPQGSSDSTRLPVAHRHPIANRLGRQSQAFQSGSLSGRYSRRAAGAPSAAPEDGARKWLTSLSGRRSRQRAQVACPRYVRLLTQACPRSAHFTLRVNVCHVSLRPYPLTHSPPSDASVADREGPANTDIRPETDELSTGRRGRPGLSRSRGKGVV